MTTYPWKIGVIDDDQVSLRALEQAVCATLPGVTWLALSADAAGRAHLAAADPDVLLLGAACDWPAACARCRQFKADERLQAIPILFLTPAHTDSASRGAALTAGADGFLDLPPTEHTWAAQLRAMARIKAADRQQALTDARMHELARELAEHSSIEVSLRAGAERNWRLVEDMPALICTFLPDSTLTYVNAAYCAFFQQQPAELLGKRFLDMIPDKAEREVVLKNYMSLTPAAPTKTYEHSVIKADGSVYWQRWVDRAVFDKQGRITDFQSVGLDISERKLAEARLQESEARHRSLLELAPIGIAVHVDNRVVFANPAVAKILRADSPQQLIGMNIFDLIHPDHLPALQARIARMRAGEPVHYPVEDVYLRLDGAPVEVEVIAASLLYEGKLAIQAIVRDVSERKRAEAERVRLLDEMQLQAQQIGQILDTVPEGVLLLDQDGRVLYANPTGVRDLVAMAAASVGDHLTHLGDLPIAVLLAAVRGGPWHEIHAGEQIFDAIARPLGAASATGQWVVVIDNVTQERALRAQLQQQERLAAVGQLAAGIAHDFNNILAIIALQGTMAVQTPDLPARMSERLAIINEQTAQATRLVQQMLDFSRRTVLERRPLDLAALLRAQADLLARTLPEHIEIVVDYGADDCVVLADPTRMQQMVMNLAVNARDAMPNGGRLYMRLTRTAHAPLPNLPAGPWLCLEIADTGTGIPPEIMPHLFEPFFTTKERGRGTGLGLAQVYGIVKQHDGEIRVLSAPGQGTTITVYLPAAAAAVAAVATPAPTAAAADGATILLVEDNPILLEAMGDILNMLGYTVVGAGNGKEALAILDEQAGVIDAVLTDLVMPQMGGEALLAAIRARGLASPVVILSGHALEGELAALKELGLAGWLLKPPNIKELAQLLTDVVARARD